MKEDSHLDHEALSELQEVMDDEFDILISTYLQDSRERIGHLEEASASGDAESYTKTAHSLKGSCINIGAPRLGELCYAAEQSGKAGDLSAAGNQVAAIAAEFAVVTRDLEAYLDKS